MVASVEMDAVGGAAWPHGDPAEEQQDLMRQRLADITRGLQWTYSIFWRWSPEQQVLVWGEGYLDGADSTGLSLRRSKQLRNLYNVMESSRTGEQLLASENNITSSLAVSVQDLTPLEWFYVGSMAVIFASGDGLPGRALVGRRLVWHYVTSDHDTRVLVRARLAQKAHLQTIVCIPALDGVLEIGTTALVEQDPKLLQQMQSLFLEHPTHHLAMRTSSISKTTGHAQEIRALGEMMTEATSAFNLWKSATFTAAAPSLPKHPQWMLKAIVHTVPHLYAAGIRESFEDFPNEVTVHSQQNLYDAGQTSRGDSGQSKHVMAERKRREELNKRFEKLRKLVPFVTKPNKESLLGDAIEYVIELQRQVKELESTAQKSPEKSVKQDVDVTIEKSVAVMKISSAWRDDQLVDILKKMEDLQLEVVDVKADVSDNKLNATLKAKVRSSDPGSDENKMEEIREALLNLIARELRA